MGIKEGIVPTPTEIAVPKKDGLWNADKPLTTFEDRRKTKHNKRVKRFFRTNF